MRPKTPGAMTSGACEGLHLTTHHGTENPMGNVITSASMSLDGFIAGPAETGFEHLFAWHRNGEIEVPSADPRWSYRVSPASAEHLREQMDGFGALVVGRRL